VSVVHPAAVVCVGAVARTPSAAAAKHKRGLYRRRGLVLAFNLVPISVDTYGPLGKHAMDFYDTLASTAATSACISMRVCMRGPCGS
jgi:hypothetical protein